MVPSFNPMSCPHLAVPAGLMQHVARVESGGNRFAIGVVRGRLERQPEDLGEAVATARMLESKGYDYSLGITQVNRSNLLRYGLDTFEKAFDGCANARAGARILAECYGRASGDWGKAFSCYYSGNFVAGYRDGYVQRILASLDANPPGTSEPITVHPQTAEHPGRNGARTQRPALPGSPAYRVSIRSVAIDTAAGALVSAVPRGDDIPTSHAPDRRPPSPPPGPAGAPGSAFVPRVSGPGEPSGEVTHDSIARDPVVSHPETADAAFVF